MKELAEMVVVTLLFGSTGVAVWIAVDIAVVLALVALRREAREPGSRDGRPLCR